MKRSTAALLALALSALPVAALAHTGHGDHGFVDGFAHPFTGVDHLLAMLAVGLWSVLHSRRIWLAPFVFVTSLSVGALAGQYGLQLPQLEALVAGSVLVLGLMLSRPFKLGDATQLSLIGGFALCHGVAHGGELTAGNSVLAGIVFGSVLLHATGMSVAHFFLKQRPQLARRVGQLVALLGGGLVLSTLI